MSGIPLYANPGEDAVQTNPRGRFRAKRDHLENVSRPVDGLRPFPSEEGTR